MQHWGIKTAAIPTDQLWGVSFDDAEELPNPSGLVGVGNAVTVAQAADSKSVGVSKGTADNPNTMQMMRQEGGLAGCLALSHERR
jgi:hypothetical protein